MEYRIPAGSSPDMEWAWLIPLFSLAAVPLIILFGKYLPGKGSFLAIRAIAAGFGLFCWVFLGWLAAGPATEDCHTSRETGVLTCEYQRVWFQAGTPGVEDNVDQGVRLVLGVVIDPLTLSMLGLITFVALMVQVYSLGYMRGSQLLGRARGGSRRRGLEVP